MSRLGRIGLGVIVFVGLVAGWWASRSQTIDYDGADQLLAEAITAYTRGDFVDSKRAALLAVEHGDDHARVLARCVAGQAAHDLGQDQEAVQILGPVLEADLSDKRDLEKQCAQSASLLAELLSEKQDRIGAAIEAYRTSLQWNPFDIDSHEAVARLYAVCGLRDAAVPHAVAVISERDSDLVMLLARENTVIADKDRMRAAVEASPNDPYPRLALAVYAWNDSDVEEALAQAKEVCSSWPEFRFSQDFYGYLLSLSGDYGELRQWASRNGTDDASSAWAWIAHARLQEHVNDVPGAIRCFGEAMRLRPDSREAVVALSRLLSTVGDDGAALVMNQRLGAMDHLARTQFASLLSGPPEDVDALRDLIGAYRDAGRLHEARFFARLAMDVAAFDPPTKALARRVLRQHRPSEPLLVAGIDSLLEEINLASYGLPEEGAEQVAVAASITPAGDADVHFTLRDRAEETGLVFQFDNGVRGTPRRRMYEFSGGGVGVIDFDGDHVPDVFLTQGGVKQSDPFEVASLGAADGDRLFRNHSGDRFSSVARQAFLVEQEFGQGVAVGDVDKDGFSDLYVANLGPNVLWRNNGDGTFSRDRALPSSKSDAWTASTLIADLNGDSLPDLFDVNYVEGEDLLTRTCEASGEPTMMCMPYHFRPTPDVVLLSAGNGEFTDVEDGSLAGVAPAAGLGAVAWLDRETATARVFVANDAMPNALLAWDNAKQSFSDHAAIAGLAYNGVGKAEGCMGIAVADLNDDGQPDFHVTNFLAESNTVYISDATGSWGDRTAELGVSDETRGRLGFGCQFFDADADGDPELLVANGHIQDLERLGKPYRMQTQLFDATGPTWQPIGDRCGPFFETERIARSAAKLDWNGDGLEDLIVTHIEAPVALLTSDSDPPGRSLRVKLIGTQSSRDGFGAVVTVRIADREITKQRTSGGGYMAENEALLHFGLGAETGNVSVTVGWPSGELQHFENVSERLIAIEPGRSQGNLVESPAE